MPAEWYYREGGEARGPVDMEELRRLARDGPVGPETPLRRGTGDWVEARRVGGLFDEFTDAPAPPPGGWQPDEPPAAAPRHGAAVTVLGVTTLVLASALALISCTSGTGAVYLLVAGNQLMNDAQTQQQAAAAPGVSPAQSQAAGCNSFVSAFVGLLAVALGVVLAAAMVLHALLAGGHFAAGAGVLRRRGWARVVALVFSALTGLYGGAALCGVVSRLANSPPPAASEAWWMAPTACLGLLFLAHTVFSWVVLLRPSAGAEFGARRPTND